MTAENDQRVDRAWVARGRRVHLGGVSLTDGLFYIGRGAEPSAIDPAQPVDLAAPDWRGTSVRGVLRYDALTPQARAAYIRWLDSGRRVPPAPSAWALLYLYGLERRVLADGDEDPEIAREASELGVVYGHDPAVRRVVYGLVPPPHDLRPPGLDNLEVPDALRVGLGRQARAARPSSAGWALAWATYHPEIPRGAAEATTPDLYRTEWIRRFTERFPNGFRASALHAPLELAYSPCNPSLPASLLRRFNDASDVFLSAGALDVLRELSNETERALAPPPPDIAVAPMAERDTRVVAAAEDALGRFARAVVGVTQLLGADVDSETDRDRSARVARSLDQVGIGLEPDVRFGGAALTSGQQAVLFRFTGPPVTSPSPAYARAVVTLELCHVVVTSDGKASDAGRALLVEQVDRAEDLTEGERARLIAHRRLLATRSVDLDDVASRVRALDVDARRQLGRYLLDVALVDGALTAAERGTLRAVADLLDLDPSDIDLQLADPETVAPPAPEEPRTPEEPAAPETPPDGPNPARAEPLAPTSTAVPARPRPSPTPRPAPTRPTAPAVGFDEQRLQSTRAANAAVQALLGTIFAEDDEDELTPSPAPPLATTVGGLDARHTALLADLATDHHWTRGQWEAGANRHGVMPDGALDVINEAAIDRADYLVIEIGDDDSVTIDPDVYEEMCR